MASGTYNGTIVISATGATTLNVPVTLTITGTSGGGTSGPMYAQPYVHYGTTSSGGLAALWVNDLGDTTQYNNQGLVLSMSASAPAGSWAGAYIQNIGSSLSLTELGFDIRDASQCTATSPRLVVETTVTGTHVFGCSTGTIQPATPVVGWRRVRFNLNPAAPAPPIFTPGETVKSITLVLDQGPGTDPSTGGGLAVIDNIYINDTFITGGRNDSHDD
jgi:hypothetical protein